MPDGVFVLWTEKGRPEASVGIYPWYGYIVHELVSLSRGEKLEARRRAASSGHRRSLESRLRIFPTPPARCDFGCPAPADEGAR